MRAYRLVDCGPDWRPSYHPTRDDAHKLAKEHIDSPYRDDVRVELVEFNTDQKTLCEILSGWGCETKVLRTWSLTQRGGLKEVANGD